MTRIERRVDDVTDASADRTIMFVLTLIVTTVIVGFAVFALGWAVIDGGAGASGHRAAIAAIHARA